MILTLPVPPSMNNAFINVRGVGRVKSKKYKLWQQAAGWALQAQPHAKIPGKVRIRIQVRRPSANSDIDNRVKPLLDLLVLHRVIDDDRNVASVYAEWADIETCSITIEPMRGTNEAIHT